MMPRRRVLQTPFRSDRILAREARAKEAQNPALPQSQLEPLMGLAAAGDLPPGAQTERVVEKYLARAHGTLKRGWEIPESDQG